MAKEQRKIHITHDENVKFFGGKLPTWRTPFCYITRAVTPVTDPNGIYDDLAQLKTPSGTIVEVGGDEIVGVAA